MRPNTRSAAAVFYFLRDIDDWGRYAKRGLRNSRTSAARGWYKKRLVRQERRRERMVIREQLGIPTVQDIVREIDEGRYMAAQDELLEQELNDYEEYLDRKWGDTYDNAYEDYYCPRCQSWLCPGECDSHRDPYYD